MVICRDSLRCFTGIPATFEPGRTSSSATSASASARHFDVEESVSSNIWNIVLDARSFLFTTMPMFRFSAWEMNCMFSTLAIVLRMPISLAVRACEDICLGTVGERGEGVVFVDAYFCEQVGVAGVAVDYFAVAAFLRQFAAHFDIRFYYFEFEVFAGEVYQAYGHFRRTHNEYLADAVHVFAAHPGSSSTNSPVVVK